MWNNNTRIARHVTVAIVLACCINQETGAQEISTSREIRLLVSVDRPDTVYPVQGRGDSGYVVFTGEPVVLQVVLANHTDETLRVARSGDGWLDALEIDFETIPARVVVARSVPYTILGTRNRETGAGVDPKLIGPGEVQQAQVQLQADSVPPPGHYFVRTTIRANTLSSLPRSALIRLSAMETIYLRAVETLADELNVLYGSGVRARLDGRLQTAVTVLRELVAKHPSSVVGWYELGLAQAQQTQCEEAGLAFQHAEQLIGGGADPSEASARLRSRPEYLRQMKQILAKCGK